MERSLHLLSILAISLILISGTVNAAVVPPDRTPSTECSGNEYLEADGSCVSTGSLVGSCSECDGTFVNEWENWGDDFYVEGGGGAGYAAIGMNNDANVIVYQDGTDQSGAHWSNVDGLEFRGDGSVGGIVARAGYLEATQAAEVGGPMTVGGPTTINDRIGATDYCDSSGNNCKEITSLTKAAGRPGSEYLLNIASDQLTIDEIAQAIGRGDDTSGMSKCDDSTAPAPGCFEVTGYENSNDESTAPYWSVDQESEYIFETWVKVQDGAGDTDSRFYAGWEMYDSSKSSYGNNQRYWGASGEHFDEDSRDDGDWHFVRGRISGVGGSYGEFIDGTEYAKLVLLMNYNGNDNVKTRYAGMKLYKARKLYTSIYAMNTQSTVDPDDSSRKLVMDKSGDVYPNNLDVSGTSDMHGNLDMNNNEINNVDWANSDNPDQYLPDDPANSNVDMSDEELINNHVIEFNNGNFNDADSDGEISFDHSDGLAIYRSYIEGGAVHSGSDVYALLDAASLAEGSGISISGGKGEENGLVTWGFDCSDVDGDYLGCDGETLDVSDNWVDEDGDTMTGELTLDESSTESPISAGPFSSNTKQNTIRFSAASGNNDPGYIIHETNSDQGNTGVLHLAPTDDNSYGDYVAIHGTNDPASLELHTDGSIEGVSSLDMEGNIDMNNNEINNVDWANSDNPNTELSETDVEQYIFDGDNDEGGMNIGGNLDMDTNDLTNVDQIYGNNNLDLYSGSGDRILMRGRGDGHTLGWYDDYNNVWVMEYNEGGDIQMRPPGNDVNLNDNDIHDANNVATNQIYDNEDGQLDVADDIDMENHQILRATNIQANQIYDNDDGELDVADHMDLENHQLRRVSEITTSQIDDIIPIYIRGTGLNHNGDRILRIGDNQVYSGSSRGLRLTVISKSDFSVVSDNTYDTYGGGSSVSDSLASALDGITDEQIGILTSYDAWESDVTSTLDNAFERLGLFKAAATENSGSRRSYAAIFSGADNSENVDKAIEVTYEDTSNQPYAEIRGWLSDRSFMATGSHRNALTSSQGDSVGVIVDHSGAVKVRHAFQLPVGTDAY